MLLLTTYSTDNSPVLSLATDDSMVSMSMKRALDHDAHLSQSIQLTKRAKKKVPFVHFTVFSRSSA